MKAFMAMKMTSIQVRPTGLLAPSDQVYAGWQLGLGELVAVIPGDPASL